MKRLFPFCLYLVAAVAAIFQADCLSSEVFYVSQVTRVISPVCFECKIKNYPAAPGVRFQVFLNNTETQTKTLRELLDEAKNIELRNVKMRNYFRMEAEVWVDGKNLNKQLTANNGTDNVVPQQKKKADLSPILPIEAEQKVSNRLANTSLNRMPDPSSGILKTRIDLTTLTSETSFYDCIEIIRDSLDYRLPIVVLWSEIENNTLVQKDTPIGVDGFRIISVELALETILHSLSGDAERITFAVEGGIVKVGTQTSVFRRTARVYSITDLLLPPAMNTSENGYSNDVNY